MHSANTQEGHETCERARCRPRQGFTILELLVVVAIIAILASLVMGAVSRGKSRASQVVCLNNLRQLSATLFVYADDNNDTVPPNGYGSAKTLGGNKLWVVGDEHLDPHAYTNVDYILNPGLAAFAPYVRSLGPYKCPADRGTVEIDGQRHRRLRNYSLNSYIGWADWLFSFNKPSYWTFQKVSHFALADPGSILLFLDVSPGNICYSAFVIRVGSDGHFYHLPGTQHGKSGAVSFADGHATMHKWVEETTIREAEVPWIPNHWTLWLKGNRDLGWLMEHCSVPKPGE
ncbi:MAG: type II secretion system GspH family protein [Verrucomicrobiae bacterium]|nr:type II secretion system GspH family protein [Verrucomicrobiae bacterium]